MIRVMPVVGVRPQIIKAAPLIRQLDNVNDFDLLLVHSGQHYDYEMSKIFFNELELPEPIENLNVGSGSHSEQTAQIMLRLEKVIKKYAPDLLIVFGDANTTIGAALAGVKLKVPVAHIESGLRSWDLRMPEEVNRVLTDHISQILYAPTEIAVENLIREGISEQYICLSGDTMYDSILYHYHDINGSQILNRLGIDILDYIVVTMHRAENVDVVDRLTSIVSALVKLSHIYRIIFPVHPRTMKRLVSSGLLEKLKNTASIKLVEPVGYIDMLRLIKESLCVITDSGGIQKEAFILGTPCITLRERTEWIETVRLGGNRLVGADEELIVANAKKVIEENNSIRKRLKNIKSPYGDGRAAEKIVQDIKRRYSHGKMTISPSPAPFPEFLE